MSPSHVGKYAILKPLGRGAMGEVLLGEDPYIGRRVAIKMMRNAEAQDAERFLQEARIIGSLSHPNIVLLLEFGFHDGQPFLAMEYLEGQSLDVWQREPRGLDEKLRVMAGLLGALGYAHGRGVLHRDIKPSNVQVMADGQAKLMDFGIARGESGKLTATGTVMGTPEYMAPEILGDATYSPLSDLFSAGVLCYELLSGQNPFSAKTVAACFSNVLHLDPAPLGEVRPELPPELARVVMACLSKAPEGRPEGAGAVLEVVEKVRRGATTEEEVAEAPRGTQTVAVPRRRSTPPVAAPAWVPPVAAPARSLTRRAVPWAAGLALLVGVAVLWPRGRTEAPEEVASAPQAAAVASTEPSATPEVPPGQPSPDAPTASALPAAAPSAGAPLRRLGSPPATRPEAAPAARPTMAPTPAPTPEPTAPPPTPSPTVAPQVVASPPPSSPPAPRATPSPAEPAQEAAEPPTPTLVSLSPHQARRGRQAVIEIEGRNLPREVEVEISRGRQRALGIRVLSRKWKRPGVLRVVLLVDSDTPLDVYSVALVDGSGRATNSLPLEIGL